MLLVARVLLERYELERPTVDAILSATGASRSRAYELAARLAALLPSVAGLPGRPAKSAAMPEATTTTSDATRAVLAYVMSHPGCVSRGGQRQHYSDGFRHFLLELRAKHASLELETFAAAVDVPLGTLKEWLRDPISAPPEPDAPTPRPSAEAAQMQTVLDAWERWAGSFLDFCEHVRTHLHVPFGRDLVARILEVHGARRPARRDGRSPDESALRGAFTTFFPGAQWVGDGMQVPVVVDGQRFTFNFELDVDAQAGAFVGACVSDEEDAPAVIDAFHDGIATGGQPPLALLLDNRPSNHTDEVHAALDQTLLIRATPERPQNKAHVEGAFGLFSRVLPDLAFETGVGTRELARRLVTVVVQTWARTLNHRPRADRGGRSRVELYADQPTDEQIEHARRALRETAARQEQARRTLEARRRPDVLQFLDDHFARLGLLDPQRHFRVAIAGFPLDAIVDGIAIFTGKVRAATLPDGADARYLLGIVKNLTAQTEGEILAATLYELRMETRDRFLRSFAEKRDAALAGADIHHALKYCVDQALETPSQLERTFWLDSLADIISARDKAEYQPLLLAAARRIEATFAVSPRERHDAVRALTDRLVAIA